MEPTKTDLRLQLGYYGPDSVVYTKHLLTAGKITEEGYRRLFARAFHSGALGAIFAAEAWLESRQPNDRTPCLISLAISSGLEQRFAVDVLQGCREACSEIGLQYTTEVHDRFARYYKSGVRWIKSLLIEALLALLADPTNE